jgi:HAD superfamily hydrolase (TIGR01509 family)
MVGFGMYKAVLFDFFGVIYDDPLKAWLKKIPVELHAEIANTTESFDKGLINYTTFLKHLSEASGHSISEIKTDFEESKVNLKVVSIVREASMHTTTALLSNAGSDELYPILKRNKLIPLFNKIFISSEVGLVKPDARIFKHVLKELKVKPNETLFIDDNLHNIKAAQRLGIETFHFNDNTDELRNVISKGGK